MARDKKQIERRDRDLYNKFQKLSKMKKYRSDFIATKLANHFYLDRETVMKIYQRMAREAANGDSKNE